MNAQKKIPVFLRIPLALLTWGVIAFGPILLGLFLRPESVSVYAVLFLAILWIVAFERFLMWRLDCFWNLKMMQNRTGKPASPDNYKELTTFKGWMAWTFLGRDLETKRDKDPGSSEGKDETEQGTAQNP